MDIETGQEQEPAAVEYQPVPQIHFDDFIAPISAPKTTSSAKIVLAPAEVPDNGEAPVPAKKGNRKSIMQLTGIGSIFSSGGSSNEDAKDPASPGISLSRKLTDTRILGPYFNLNLSPSTEAETNANDSKLPEVSISTQVMNDGRFGGLFPGWGTTRVVSVNYHQGHCVAIADTENGKETLEEKNASAVTNRRKYCHQEEDKLTLFPSVCIAGCDLLSSCLYTAGTCASYAGKLAPIGLILVTLMLMFFRHVYSEVVSCIPINGGTYNSMLNTTSKKAAAVAGCLSILAYVATAIISAYDGMVYLQILWPGLDLRIGTIVVMALFFLLTLYGVKESSMVSCVMLSYHVTIMLILIVWCFIYGCIDGFQIFNDNMHSPLLVIRDEKGGILSSGKLKVLGAIFYGYSSALLGITGFESAANYVESLKSTRTFVHTVNWLWRLVGFFNPGLSIVCMMVLPMEAIYASPSDLLAVMGAKVGGDAFSRAICVDALLVLCGAVLTSYVGVSGLLVRLANDKILPRFVATESSSGAPVAASLLFFLVSSSLFLFLYKPGDIKQISSFGGVYAIAFLCVLIMFASSAIMLKLYRSNMARLVIARWWEIWLSLTAVAVGLIGNITLTPTVFILFIIYFLIFVSTCAFMFLRVDVYSFFIWMLRKSIITAESKVTGKEVDELIVEAAQTQKHFKEYIVELNEEFKEDDSAKEKEAPHDHHDDGMIGIIRRTSNSVIDVGTALGMRRRSTSVGSQHDQEASSHHSGKDKEKHVPKQLSLALSLLGGITRRRSSNNIIGLDGDRWQKKELLELDAVMAHNRFLGSLLRYFMVSLDSILKEPFVYLCKVPDPIVLRLAMEYINDNELTNNVLLVHFVDDREVMKSHKKFMHGIKDEIRKGNIGVHEEEAYSQAFLLQSTMISHAEGEDVSDLASFLSANQSKVNLPQAVAKLPSNAKSLSDAASLFDTYYNKKRVSCLVIRGTYFCPSSVSWLSCYLNLPPNSMIMGTPSEKFPFPVGALNGIRIALPEPMRLSRDNASGSVINSEQGLKYMRFQ